MNQALDFQDRQRVPKGTGQVSSWFAGRSTSGGFPFPAPQLSSAGLFAFPPRDSAQAERVGNHDAARDASVGSGFPKCRQTNESRDGWRPSGDCEARTPNAPQITTQCRVKPAGRSDEQDETSRGKLVRSASSPVITRKSGSASYQTRRVNRPKKASAIKCASGKRSMSSRCYPGLGRLNGYAN